MSDLLAIAYDDRYKAAQVRSTLLALQKAYLVDLEDAVVVTREEDGKLALDQLHNVTRAEAVRGAWWGLLIGVLFAIPLAAGPGAAMLPLLGSLVGAGTGALAGKLTDYGIDDNFIRGCSEALRPGASALFVLLRKATPDRLLDAIRPYGGTVLQTSLTRETERRLQETLSSMEPDTDTLPDMLNEEANPMTVQARRGA